MYKKAMYLPCTIYKKEVFCSKQGQIPAENKQEIGVFFLKHNTMQGGTCGFAKGQFLFSS
jgi:hypothetical protein